MLAPDPGTFRGSAHLIADAEFNLLLRLHYKERASAPRNVWLPSGKGAGMLATIQFRRIR